MTERFSSAGGKTLPDKDGPSATLARLLKRDSELKFPRLPLMRAFDR